MLAWESTFFFLSAPIQVFQIPITEWGYLRTQKDKALTGRQKGVRSFCKSFFQCHTLFQRQTLPIKCNQHYSENHIPHSFSQSDAFAATIGPLSFR